MDRQRMRALLAFLLLHANEPVSSDRLIDEVWGPTPAKTAGASLQNYVSRLRKAIGPELLLSAPAGYVLRVDPERFDLARFERLTAEARGAKPRERAEKLTKSGYGQYLLEVNGPGRHPLYDELTRTADAAGEAGDVQWNFEKFLVDPQGEVVARLRPQVQPESDEVVSLIESHLPGQG